MFVINIFPIMMGFFFSKRQYSRNSLGDQIYPKNGSGEYYLYNSADGTPLFAKDRHGIARYARDVSGNELYPKPPSFVLHPRLEYPMYARDASGNETYPKWKGREVMAVLRDGEMLAARYASGRQRYPLDRHGNEYFPLCKITRKPYYLFDERGIAYRPVTANGFEMCLRGENFYEKKDALGTTVYTVDRSMRSGGGGGVLSEKIVLKTKK